MAHPQTNQMMMLIASFSLQACLTSGLFIPPNQRKKGDGTNHVNIHTSATHFFLADVILMTSVVSVSAAARASSASFSCIPFFSMLPNMLREGAYASVPKLDCESS